MGALDIREKNLYDSAKSAVHFYAHHPECKDNLTEMLIKFAKSPAVKEYHQQERKEVDVKYIRDKIVEWCYEITGLYKVLKSLLMKY